MVDKMNEKPVTNGNGSLHLNTQIQNYSYSSRPESEPNSASTYSTSLNGQETALPPPIQHPRGDYHAFAASTAPEGSRYPQGLTPNYTPAANREPNGFMASAPSPSNRDTRTVSPSIPRPASLVARYPSTSSNVVSPERAPDSPPKRPPQSTLRSPRPPSAHAGAQTRTLSIAPSFTDIKPRTLLVAGATGRKANLLINSIGSHEAFKNLRVLSFSERGDASAQMMYAHLIKNPRSFFCVESPDHKALRKALQDVDILFYNPPSGDRHWVATAMAPIAVAKEVGVGHFIFCSVLHPQLSKLIHHADKLQVEEGLIESGLNYTILQAGIPMQNVDVRSIVSTSQYTLPYPHTTLQSFIDIHDLALVVRKIILNSEPHNRATYQLVGQTCSHEDIARDIGVYSNKAEVECVRVDRRDFVGDGSANEYEADVLDRVLLYYERRGVTGNSNVLRWLLGRSPTTFSVMLHRDYQVSDYSDAYIGMAE